MTETFNKEFEIWKTIKLGTGLKTADDFRKALESNGFGISDWTNDILKKAAFTVAFKETEIDLVKVTVAELGFKEATRSNRIYKRAIEIGLELCPAEVGPQLRLQYPDQPKEEYLLIGMEPIPMCGDFPYVFALRCDDSRLSLGYSWDNPIEFWNLYYCWVFVSPRK